MVQLSLKIVTIVTNPTTKLHVTLKIVRQVLLSSPSDCKHSQRKHVYNRLMATENETTRRTSKNRERKANWV